MEQVEAAKDVGHQAESGPAPLPEELAFIPIEPGVDGGMSDETLRQATEHFRVRPTDVICATFPKTGTTVVTWLCHQLRTGGHVDFEDMYQVAPWILLSWDLGMDPNVDGSQFFPRVFKSHLRLGSVWRGCKYVVTVRDPVKTSESFYNFLAAKGIESVIKQTPTEFVRDTSFVLGNGGSRASIFDFYNEYYVCRECPSVLVLVYEDLVKDMRGAALLLADFMGVPVSDERIDKAVAMSSKEFMAQHEPKLDESWVFERAKRLGRSPDGAAMWTPAKRVVLGGHKAVLDEEGRALLSSKWAEAAPGGFATYAEFAGFFRAKNAKRLAELSGSATSS